MAANIMHQRQRGRYSGVNTFTRPPVFLTRSINSSAAHLISHPPSQLFSAKHLSTGIHSHNQLANPNVTGDIPHPINHTTWAKRLRLLSFSWFQAPRRNVKLLFAHSHRVLLNIR